MVGCEQYVHVYSRPAVDFFNHLNILYGTLTEFVRDLGPGLTRSAQPENAP